MNRRHVNRANARPSYSRQSSSSSRPQLPQLPRVARRFWIRLGIAGTGILLVLVLIARSTTLSAISVHGEAGIAEDRLTTLVKEGLQRQWLGRSLLLVNTSGLGDYLLEREPAIKSVRVSRKLPRTLVVTIIERQPSLNWKTAGNSYLLDANGTIIGPTAGEYAKLPTITDSNNLPVGAGDRVVPTAFVGFCRELVGLLPGVGYQVSGMSVPASTSEVYVQTTNNITLKFDTTRPAGEEVADLKQVQLELKRAKKQPTQYIDLRIQHKAYYK
ncbi:MAG TPA: FtsQ-type POTRA domain-containing protein [Candidatus Polarisedimenticolaceae bacterium]|nr:FtsQ-type POTRA domain-containing protein [Candidatus Polarisedimenticolaceae bacterium]